MTPWSALSPLEWTLVAVLVSAGLSLGQIEVGSHGESNLLVPTADNVNEPRNRRVEVTVR